MAARVVQQKLMLNVCAVFDGHVEQSLTQFVPFVDPLSISSGLPLDKDAASRFIKAAIANQPDKPAPDSKFYTAATAVNDPLAGPGPHSRLNSLARASVKDTSENSVSATASEEEDEDLQVFTDAIQNKPSLSTKEQADQLGHNIVSSGNENGSSSDMPVESANKVAKKRKHMQHESKPIPTVLDALSGRFQNHVCLGVAFPPNVRR